MKRECAECGHKLVGRTDKKFCNDYCRNSFNNKRYRKEQYAKREIQGVLNVNYSILKSICSQNSVAESTFGSLGRERISNAFFYQLIAYR